MFSFFRRLVRPFTRPLEERLDRILGGTRTQEILRQPQKPQQRLRVTNTPEQPRLRVQATPQQPRISVQRVSNTLAQPLRVSTPYSKDLFQRTEPKPSALNRALSNPTLPLSTTNIRKTANLGRELFIEAPARAFTNIGVEGARNLTRNLTGKSADIRVQATNPLTRFLLGDRDVTGFQAEGEQFGLKGKPALGVGLVAGGLDLIPGVGKASTKVVRQLSKASTREAVEKALRPITKKGFRVGDDVIQEFIQTGDKKAIKEILDRPGSVIKKVDTRVGPETQRELSDWADYQMKRYTPSGKEATRLNKTARKLTKETGIDFVNGSPAEIQTKVANFLDQVRPRLRLPQEESQLGQNLLRSFGNRVSRLDRNELGAVKIPGGKDLPDQIKNLPPEARVDLDGVAQRLGMKNIDELVKAVKQPKGASNIAEATGMKTRGFKKNVFKDNFYKGNPTAKAVVEAIPGYKPITNKKTLSKAAKAINENPQAEYARVVTKPQLTSADDVATGNLLLREAIERGDTEAAIQIGTKLGIDGTKLGQAVQAYATFKRTTPEGIVTYASKQAGKAGRQLDPVATRQLIDTAQRIADMPEGLEKAKATRELLGQAENLGRTWKNTIGEILSTPRAAMATADLSAPLRQGAVLGSRFPKQWAEASAQAINYFRSPGVYEKAMYEITQRPTYALMKSHKLAVSGAEKLAGTEEQFLKNILETDLAKKLGVGQVVAASDRAYTGFLTKLRADVFDKVVKESTTAGVKLDKKALDSLARFINSASGRGTGKITDQVSKLQVLFSPKLWKSRLDLLNPVYYARLDPVARKYAIQASASFAAIATTVLGVASAAGAAVEWDPRSADFAKIKVGNTRYDILGGLQQNIRLLAQMVTGEKINSETGELQTLGPDRGFGKPSRLDLLYQFIENKENPAVAFGTKLLRGTDPVGEPINPATEFAKLFIPLTAQSLYETAKDQGSIAKGAAMNLPGTFGIGVQTYGGSNIKGAAPKTSDKSMDEIAQKVKEGTLSKSDFIKGLPDRLSVYGRYNKDQLEAIKSERPDLVPDIDRYQQVLKSYERMRAEGPKINPGTPQGAAKLLQRHARLTDTAKERFKGGTQFREVAEETIKQDLKQYGKYQSFKPSTELALRYAHWQNDINKPGMSDIDRRTRTRKFYKEAFGLQYSKEARDLYQESKGTINDLIDEGMVDPDAYNQAVQLDAALYKAGLIKRRKFGRGRSSGSGARRGSRRGSAKGGTSAGGRIDVTNFFGKSGGNIAEAFGNVPQIRFRAPQITIPSAAPPPRLRIATLNLPSQRPTYGGRG